MKIIQHGTHNPRVIVGKFADVGHNTLTIDGLPPPRRKRKTGEIIGFWSPFAEMCGMFTTQESLERQAMYHMEKKAKRRAQSIDRHIEKTIPDELLFALGEELAGFLHDFPVEINVRRPTMPEIFHRVPTHLPITQDDIVVPTDIVFSPRYGSVPGNVSFLTEHMMNIAVRFCSQLQSPFSSMEQEISTRDLMQELQSGETDCLSFHAVHQRPGQSPYTLAIRVFPHEAYERDQASIAVLYQSPEFDADERMSRTDPQYIAAREKLDRLGLLQVQAAERMEQGDEMSLLSRRLRRGIPHGYMRVVGEDAKGRREKWTIPKGFTVIQYMRDIRPNHWQKTRSVEIERKGSRGIMPLSTMLEPGDIIHGVFSDTDCWDPEMIHGLKNEPNAAQAARSHVLAAYTKQEKEIATREADMQQSYNLPYPRMRDRILEVGEMRIEAAMREIQTQAVLRGGLSSVWPQIVTRLSIPADVVLTEQEFIFQVGIGQVDTELLRAIAPILVEENQKAKCIRVTFEGDQHGIMQALSGVTTRLQISISDILMRVIGEKGPAFIDIYLSPEIAYRLQELIYEINNDPDCRTLGLAWVQ